MKKILVVIFSILMGVIGCLCVAAFVGEDPVQVLLIICRGSFGRLIDVGYTLFYTTPLIFTGLSVAVAFHCGLFNIGAEGQLYMGALALAAVGITVPQLPLAPIIGIMVAFLGGAIWGGIAGFLKSYRGSHEVIVTIMLNFISYAICGFAIMNVFKNKYTQNPETALIGKDYWLPGVGKISEVSPMNFAFFIALGVALLVWVILFKTRWGFELRMVGSSPETARRVGVPIRRRIVEAMALSGGLAGLVAVNEIMGSAHKFRDQFSSGYGFMGIAVALLGRNRPLGIIFAALLFGALQKGSLELEIDTDNITRDLAGIMQALIILFVASEHLWSQLFQWVHKKRVRAS